MQKFKTELHCHSRDASNCSKVSAEEIACKYIEHGYSTIVLTNHLSYPSTGNSAGSHVLSDIIEYEYRAYDLLCKAASEKLNILFGLEINFKESRNDYLVYGLTKDFLLSCENIFDMGIAQFHQKAANAGCLVIQAHPFREFLTILPSNYVDGYEVFNGHPGHNSRNQMAEAWADYQNVKLVTSGTDHHDHEHIPNAGILTDVKISSMEQLTSILKSGNYELIKT